MSGIHNPVDIGNKAINVEELKRSEWLTAPTRLKQPEIELPEQVNLVFASDEKNIPSSVFMRKAEERKPIVKWEKFSPFNQLVNTMAYLQRALKKTKRALKINDIEEAKITMITTSKLLQQKEFAEEIKSLKAEKENQKSTNNSKFLPSLNKWDLFLPKAK